jgi:hypothetical protein
LHTPPEIDDATTYSRISAAAIVALLLGFASLTAFIGPAFLIFPVAAAGIGLLALANINRSDGALTGAGLARRGIFLAIAFAVAAFVRTGIRDYLVQKQAGKAALQWVQLLADHRIDEARALLTSDGAAMLVPPSMSEPPQPQQERESVILERLRGDELSRAAAAASQRSIQETTSPSYDGPRTIVKCTLTLGDPSGDHRHATIQLSRYPAYERTASPWHIDHWSLESPEEPTK